MKAVVVFMLLFAVAYCQPVKRSVSSSESEDVQPVESQAMKDAVVSDDSSEEDDDDSDESDENTESTTLTPTVETTLIPIINGRGDSMDYQSDYKKHIYVDGNNIEKLPSSYKSYGSDKTEYDANGVDLKVYKALQVHNEGLDQGMDTSSGTEEEDTSQQEQKAASTSSASDSSPSQESDEANSASSEENTTMATTSNSDSSESEESNAADQPTELKSENPEVIIAK